MKIQVIAKPQSKQAKITELEDGKLVIYLKSSPVDSKVNQELISLLAKKYQVKKKQIKIKTGISSKVNLIPN